MAPTAWACQDAYTFAGDARTIMWFALLGPLQVAEAGQRVLVSGTRQRTLLAALLLRSGQPLSRAQLAEMVWDGAPPLRSAVTLRSYVMRLRQSLGHTAAARIVTAGSGYAMDVAEDEFDVTSFIALCRTGEVAGHAGEWQRAVQALTRAQSLWRGDPLADIPSQVLRAVEVPRLEQLHTQATTLRIEAELHIGHCREVVPELRTLIARHALQEPLHALLMLALYRAGSQADALGAYRDARRVLVAQLGIEPGPELQDLHRRMLAGDPRLMAEPRPDGPAIPRQLPPPVRHFSGRAAELAALNRMADADASADHPADPGRPVGGNAVRTTATVVISAIAGTAGVGKTALALQWAHQAADRFPDGQLYVNLHGYHPDQPMPPGEALAGFLRALGVAAIDIPAEAEERAAKYRSLLADRRVLVVLDNARSAEQVRPLLAGTRGCVALVTSRDALAGLVARDDAQRLELDLLSPDDAVALLRTLIGARADVDPAATRMLAVQCARLPLALRVAAEFVASRPATAVSDLVNELAEQEQSLDLLDASGDSRTAVRTVFSWSYRQLDPAAARAFRLLGLHPGADVDVDVAGALLGTTRHRTGRLLDQLVRAHLVQLTVDGRYSLHDLLRAYAKELAAGTATDPDRPAALTRMFDHYLRTAAGAMDLLFPAERHRRPDVRHTGDAPFAGPDVARVWLDTQRANLVAVTGHADASWPGYADLLAGTVFRYLDDGGHFHQMAAVYERARIAACERRDRAAEAAALQGLGAANWRLCRYDVAAGHLREALDRCRQTGNRASEARALGTLGLVLTQQGHFEQAVEYYQQSVDLYRQIGDPEGETSSLGNLGDIELKLGRYDSAAGYHEEALRLARRTGNQTCEVYALLNIGAVSLRTGGYEHAVDHLRQALDLSRRAGNRGAEAYALANLGDLNLRRGLHQPAAVDFEQALVIFHQTGDRSGEAEALIGLGDVALATGRPADALTGYATAFGLATQIGNTHMRAYAARGLARGYQATGDPARAREHWHQALDLFADLGAPEADEIRALLGR